jgi:hypothetical protein
MNSAGDAFRVGFATSGLILLMDSGIQFAVDYFRHRTKGFSDTRVSYLIKAVVGLGFVVWAVGGWLLG